jgi:hypothetical protein
MENEILDYFADNEYYKGRIIAIKYFYFESQARLYAARLREAGIRCFVSNANTITAFPLGDGGIGLHIREKDSEEAIHIIRQMDKNNLQDSNDFSFRDADEDDIQYFINVNEKNKNKLDPEYITIVVILLLVILSSFLRAMGTSFTFNAF